MADIHAAAATLESKQKSATGLSSWLKLFKAGDYIVILLSALLVGWSFTLFWKSGHADYAVIRKNGIVVDRVDLQHTRRMRVSGPVGETEIAIEPGRARIVSDPGLKQYCVRQGWLSAPGAVAICAPNQVSVQLVGRTRPYDSLSY